MKEISPVVNRMSQMDHRVCKLTQVITVFSAVVSWTSFSHSCKRISPSTQGLRFYCCPFLWPKSWGEEEEFDRHSSVGLSGVTLFCCCPPRLCCVTLFTLNIQKHSAQQRGVRPLAARTYVSVSPPVSLSVTSVRFSGCHIMSLSEAGHVTTCRLGSGPSVCWEEGDIWWAKWTKASGNWFHLRFAGQDTHRESYFLGVNMFNPAVTRTAGVWVCVITWSFIHWIWVLSCCLMLDCLFWRVTLSYTETVILAIPSYKNSSQLWCQILFLPKSHKLYLESGFWTNQWHEIY